MLSDDRLAEIRADNERGHAELMSDLTWRPATADLLVFELLAEIDRLRRLEAAGAELAEALRASISLARGVMAMHAGPDDRPGWVVVSGEARRIAWRTAAALTAWAAARDGPPGGPP